MRGPDSGIVVTFAAAPLCAGFPSPAQDYGERPLDLARLLVRGGRRPTLHEAARPDGTLSVYLVDAGLAPRGGDLVLADLDGTRGLARVAQDGAALLGRTGRRVDASAGSVVGVATWRLLGLRGEPLGPAGLSGLAGAPSAFMFRVSGLSMRAAGIGDGDLLIVDRAAAPGHGDVVVAACGGARSVKRLLVSEGRPMLAFENPEFPGPAPFEAGTSLFGVATWALRRLRP